MMSLVEKLDLATIAAHVEVPKAAVWDASGSRGRRDRLTELADWWATVAGTAAPAQVAQLWLPRPSSAGPALADVTIGQLDPPQSIPAAIDWGIAAADDAIDDGTDLLLVSVQDLSWQVLGAKLLEMDAVSAVGWPSVTGLSDAQWMVRVAAIRDGLRNLRDLHSPNETIDEPERLLERLNSPAIAAGTGLLLRSAARRTPAILDGPGAATCALLAHRICGAAVHWWLAADTGAGALIDQTLSSLELTPLTRLGLNSEDGTAARIALNLLEIAVTRASDTDPGV